MKPILLLLFAALPALAQFTSAHSIWSRPIDSSAPTDGYAIVWSASQSKWVFSGSVAPANSLTLSGSIVGSGSLNMPISGMSCGKVVLGYASLTAGVQAQEIPFLAVPANFHIDMIRMNPATLYAWAASGTTMTVSIQQQGNTSSPDIMPATNIMSAGVFLDDLPANPSLSSHTISIYLVGNANFSNLNAGSLQVTYCGHVVL